ncbi:class E sortase [Streptomyces sp. NPDC020799]|uniref:class E sortase n=1 Tax=Streptomyces sp. NPDC020799 TaxID=3365091 RepID=UPI00379FCDA4
MSARLVVRTLSELCVTIGTLIVLLVVYVLYWTGIRADSAMDGELDRLHERWSAAAPPTERPPDGPATRAPGQAAGQAPGGTAGGTAEQPAGQPAGEASAPTATGEPGGRQSGTGGGGETVPRRPAAYVPGDAFAVMYIPRLGSGWAKPVLQGTGTANLKKGLGHYDRTAGLGETGNFAVAGHRRTYGDPFKDLPELRAGDAVVLTDGTTWFTYRVDGAPYRTRPDDIGVIDPVPAESGYREPGRYLTLTTCEPEWGHSHRLIVWAHLEATGPVAEGKPKALLS